MRLEPGSLIDVWCVEQRLGSGGMGAVYRCFNRSAPRIRAALKILDPTLAYDPEIRARFVREAELLFALEHPNIVKVRNINMEASPPFIEMAFCQGRPLDAVLRDGPMPFEVAALVGAQVAEALAHVHKQGIRHRDVKPANIIVNGDQVTLVDFGIATEGAARTMNLTGGALGTVSYAPPEWGSKTVTDPTLWDAYSLGQVIWECTTGRTAFEMPTGMDMREGIFHLLIQKGDAGPLEISADAPAPLRELVQRLTHPDPNQRQGDLSQAASVLWAHARRGTGFFPEVEPLGDPTVVVDEPEAGSSDTMFFPDMDEDELGGADLPSEAPLREPAEGSNAPMSPSAATIADPSLNVDPSKLPAPRRRRLLGMLVVGVGLVGLAAGAAWLGTETPPEDATKLPKMPGSSRPIQLIHKGAAPQAPYTTYVGGERVQDGQALNLLPGSYEFEVVVGEDCDLEGGERPAWCGVSKRTTHVAAGTGPTTITVSFPVPEPPEVTLSLTGASASQARADNGGWADIRGSDVSFSDLAPGPHTILVRGGVCPEDAPCNEACPKTCSEGRVEVVVPFIGEDPVHAELVMPDREDPQRAVRRGGRVTQIQFARWVKANPKYAPEQVRGTRLADAGYIKSWSLSSPTPRSADQVPPAIAGLYCGKQGLSPVSASPQTWDEGAISYEIRAGAAGRPVLLHFSGAVSNARSSQSTSTVGFRCR